MLTKRLLKACSCPDHVQFLSFGDIPRLVVLRRADGLGHFRCPFPPGGEWLLETVWRENE